MVTTGTIRLTFLCAAPTAASYAGRFPADEPADEKALSKLRPASFRFAKTSTFFSNESRSARETCLALGAAPIVEPTLNDIDFGRWSGRTLDSVLAEEPGSYQKWISDPYWACEGGVSIASLCERVARWLSELNERTDHDGRVVVVAQSSIIRAAIVYTLNAPLVSFWRIDVSPFDTVCLSGRSGRWNLTAIQNARMTQAAGEC